MTTTQLRPTSIGRPRDSDERPRRWLRPRWALVAALVVVLGIFVTWLVAYSPVLGVRSVQVDGERTLRASVIEQAAGIDYGQPLVRVDTAAITQRIEALPQIESAQVKTSFPSSLVITVVERTPVGYVMLAGRRMLVDRSGEQYLGVDAKDAPPDLPRLVVPAGTDRHTTGGAIATVAASLPAALRARTSSIEALDPAAITVALTGKHGNVIVRWGSAARSATKARVVAALVDRKHVDTIDVTNPERPFTR